MIDMENIIVGSKIKFTEDHLWFTVQARNERFIICTTKGSKYHSIIDLKNNIRGDDNLVFHSGYDDQQHCEARLSEFINGDLEISKRNNVPLKILKIQ